MVSVEFKMNSAKLMRELDSLKRKQISFATARALTQVAQEIKKKTISDLDHYFTIRKFGDRKSWVKLGIRIVPAKKQDWPSPVAEVGTKDDFMRRQEEGGEKKAEGHALVAVPIRARRRKTDITRKSMWPKALMRKKGVFRTKLRKSGLLAVVNKTNDFRYPDRARPDSDLAKQRAEERKKLDVFYLLLERVHVKPQWQFVETAKKYVEKNYAKIFGRELSRAIGSRKR